MFIKDVATVFSGLTSSNIFREPFSKGLKIKSINATCINKLGEIELNKTEAVWIDSSNTDQRFYLREGDIVITVRGHLFKAGLISIAKCDTNRYIANMNFAIIRTDKTVLRPEVLVSFLNSRYFTETVINQTKTKTMLISLKKLSIQVIPITSLEQQDELAKLFYSFQSLQKDTLELLNQQATLAEAKLLNTLFKD